tara:strand:- start:1405 stop:2787 length:1383 start_codon:yes stop_codon:yes gene_type:complete
MKSYDVIIIGGGPGGYVAAIRASQLGKKVAIVEENHMGGVCLNWGCIPTKFLLSNAHLYDLIQNAGKYGIDIGDVKVNWPKMIKRSRDVAKRLSKGIEYLIKKNNIDYIAGKGKILNVSTVLATMSDQKSIEYNAKNIILATGARAKHVPGMEIDGVQVISYREAMTQEKKPKSLVIIGAGAIGVEFAHFYHTFGTDITLIETMPNILPVEDVEISEELKKIFIKRKMNVLTETKVQKIEKLTSSVKVHTSNNNIITADQVLIAIGVQGNIENLGLEESQIELENGWIKTSKFMETSCAAIYAIGDLAGPPWLAHVASAEGIVAAEHLAGCNPSPMEYDNIPGCTYCNPEVASVGLTEKEAIELGYDIKVGKFPFRALGKAVAVDETEGFVKVIYDAKYDEMLGCHIIGSNATNIITEATIARKLESTYYEVLHTVHPHPTLSEAIMEATADAYGEAIHI